MTDHNGIYFDGVDPFIYVVSVGWPTPPTTMGFTAQLFFDMSEIVLTTTMGFTAQLFFDMSEIVLMAE